MNLEIPSTRHDISSARHRALAKRSAWYQPGATSCRKKGVHSERKRTSQSVEIDFDLLVSSIENSIMADQGRAQMGITPQELLVRSNPAIYSFERELTRDLTNPREMYSLLSNAKSTEDLTVQFKQDIVKKIQAPGALPKLSRATTLNEIKRIQQCKSDKLGRFQSASGIVNSDRKLNVLVLTHNRTSIEDFRTIAEENKENIHALNLPNITCQGDVRVDVTDNDKNKKVSNELSAIPFEKNAENKTKKDTDYNNYISGATKTNYLTDSDNLKTSDPKLEKWFSEMPNEVFDKAQRAIMEASIKDKLVKYQHKRNIKEKFPSHVNVLHGSRLRKVPNTFLEMRVDSFGKHLKNENRMEKYKLHQKSLHKLKMREVDDIERQEKMGREDTDFTPRFNMQYRSHTTIQVKHKSDAFLPKQKRDIIPDDKGLKKFDINEILKRDIMPRERVHINNYQDYAERLHLSKSTSDSIVLRQSEHETIPKSNSPISKESETGLSGHDRGIAKTTVVNIALEKDTPRLRQPLHIDQNIKNCEETENARAEKYGGNVETNEASDVIHKGKDAKNEGETFGKEGNMKCVTKIPTARSSRTSDSNRSIISSKHSPRPNKSVLSRFNKLEVFAENGKAADAKMTRKSYQGHKLRDHEITEKATPPSYKLDLKKYPQHFNNPVLEEVTLINTEVRKQDLIFRFEPGEVFITRKPNPNRASERARIIYGKVLNRHDRSTGGNTAESKAVNEFNSVQSLSTRLDGYKFEIGNFENRALADSIPSDSVREHEHPNTRISNLVNDKFEYINKPELDTTSTVTKTPLEWYNKFGKIVRDIAVETEILGSDEGNLQQHAADGLRVSESQSVNSTESDLSGFIVENNDGESLNSDFDLDNDLTEKPVQPSQFRWKSRGTQSNTSNKI